MITIVKGSSKLVVTNGTYEQQYKKLGYQIASEKMGATKKVAPLLKKEEEKPNESLFEKEEINEEENLSKKFGLKNEKTSTSKKGK